MRRKEKTQGWIFVVLSVLLILSVGVSYIRIAFASNDLHPDVIKDFAGIYGKITDRFDQVIYEDGKTLNYDLFGNIIGHGRMIQNSLICRYTDELKPGKINFITGFRNIEKNPRVMKTTLLSEESLQEIAKLYGSSKGCCFAYNYETGEVYVALSFPSYNPAVPPEERVYINRCFDSVFIPGSTMKVITTAIAVEQDLDLKKFTYNCNGSYVTPDGEVVGCEYEHGEVNYLDAIGKSCNGYFLTLATKFNLDESLNSFKELGFDTNKNESTRKIETIDFRRCVSSVGITNLASKHNIWAFAGQGDDQVNPVHMAMLAGAIANEGEAAEPYLVKSIYNQDNDEFIYELKKSKTTEFMSAKTASTVAKLWKSCMEDYYYNNHKSTELNRKITCAKTGTAQIDSQDNPNKLLIGYIEESKTAFYIIVEDHNDDLPKQVANKLAEIISKQ